MITTAIELNFGTKTITGRLDYYPGGSVMVECLEAPGMFRDDGAAALRSAVRDGRIKLPPKVRAAIDNGAKVL